LIEVLVLVPSYLRREQEQVEDLAALGQTLGSVFAALPQSDVIDWHPRLAALMTGEPVVGVALQRDGETLAMTGESPQAMTMPGHVRSRDGARIDLALSLEDGSRSAFEPKGNGASPRFLVLRLDASSIAQDLRGYLGRVAGIVTIIAAFVTLVTMAVVGRLVLIPLLDLRQVLTDLRPDGGTPSPRRHLTRSDELGEVFRAVEDTRERIASAMAEVEALARFPSENPNPVLRCRADGSLLYANEATRNQPEFLGADGLPNRVITDLVGMAASGNMVRGTEAVLGDRVFALKAAPVATGGYVNIYAADVTARVSAERELRTLNESLEDLVEARTRDLGANEARLRTVIDTMVDGLIVIDQTGTIETFNVAAQRIFGYGESEMVGQPVSRLMDREEANAHDSHIHRYLDQGHSKVMDRGRQVVGRRKDGTLFPMSLAVSEVGGGTGTRRLFTGVMRDISDQIKREEDLREAMECAETANRAKTDFLATMSHELRTPLNGVIGMAELLRDTDLDESQTKYAKTITDSALALLAIINDILDLSKIEAGRLELDSQPLDPRATLESVANLMDGRAREKGLVILTEPPPTPSPLVLGDEGRLRQVLLNLSTNAVKFTNGGSVTLRLAEVAPERFRFEVRDTGIGIAETDHHRLFRDFTQVSPSTSRRYGGTGLGLAICKRLVTLMGGKIGFDSWPGAGSLFWFELPMPHVRDKDTSPTQAIDLADTPPLDVLVVEDNEINQQVAEGLLGKLGHRITCVSNGLEAVDILDRRAFDVVLMDVQMPEMDGYEATRRIRQKTGPIARIPIIAMTANATNGDVEAAMLSGMNGYLSKPVTRKRLAESLAKHAVARTGDPRTSPLPGMEVTSPGKG
jgi:PAS domain S-box-containing protein